MATTIQARERNDLRKSQTRRLRNEGFVPAVVYGKDFEPITVAVNSIDLVKKVRDEGRNAVFALQVEGGNALNVLLYDYQSDHIKDELVHVDFYKVDMSSEVDVEVNVQLEGEAKGEADGGVKQQTLYALNVRATPNNIPDVVTVDISELAIGEGITVGDLKGSRNYEILDDDETTIVTIVPPQLEETPDDEEGQGDAAEEQAEATNDNNGDEE